MRGAHSIHAALLLCIGSAAAADEQPICADRPGKATSACTVPAGRWQIETGFADWTLQRSEGERDTSLAIGETTIKYGLTAASDIEIDFTPWQMVTSRANGTHASASGIGDLDILYKQGLSADDAPVQFAIEPIVKIPTASRSLGNGEWEGRLLLPVAYAVPKSPFSIALTPEADWVADADQAGQHLAMEQVVSLGWAATNTLNLSAELWGGWDWDPAGTSKQVSADGSAALLVNRNVQLDAGANFGLNRATPDVELYAGVSERF